MRSLRNSWLLALVAFLSACSLLVDFDPEGQPCDSRDQCLPDFACEEGVCVFSPGAMPDGGTSGQDGGT